jgi:hypothetical protein
VKGGEEKSVRLRFGFVKGVFMRCFRDREGCWWWRVEWRCFFQQHESDSVFVGKM